MKKGRRSLLLLSSSSNNAWQWLLHVLSLLLVAVTTTMPTTTLAQVVVSPVGNQDTTDSDSSNNDCLPTINQVALRESTITDTSIPRVYKLCPGTTFTMGRLNFDNQVENGQRMLPLRSNLKVQCGDTGSRTNNCVLDDGDLHVDGTDHFGIVADDDAATTAPMDNVVLQGLTFRNVTKYMAWLNRPGTVEFVDCEFRDNENALTPVLLDFFNPKDTTQELAVTFKNCVFDQNQYFGMPAQPALIVGNGMQNRIIIQETRFTNNDMLFNNTLNETNSFLVETSGPITVLRSCFENNKVGVSPIAVYGTEYLFAENFQEYSAGSVCIMSSHFETAEQYELFQPRCERFDLRGFGAICPLDGTSAPTNPPAPTSSPTSAPTPMTPAPSQAPSTTMTPSTMPSWYPTPQPTERPSALPTIVTVETPAPSPAPVFAATAEPTLQSSTTFSDSDLPPFSNRPPVGIELTEPPTLAPAGTFTTQVQSGSVGQRTCISMLLVATASLVCWFIF